MRIYVGSTNRDLASIKTHAMHKAKFHELTGKEKEDFIRELTNEGEAYIKLLDSFEAMANKLKEFPIGTLTTPVRNSVTEGGQFILEPTNMEGYDYSLGVFAPLLAPITTTQEPADYDFDAIDGISVEEINNYKDAINTFLLNFTVVELQAPNQPESDSTTTPINKETLILAAIRHLQHTISNNGNIDHLVDLLEGATPNTNELSELAIAINLSDIKLTTEPLSITIHKWEDSKNAINIDVMSDTPERVQVQMVDSTANGTKNLKSEVIMDVTNSIGDHTGTFPATVSQIEVGQTRLTLTNPRKTARS